MRGNGRRPSLTVVGVGPGDPRWVTPQARHAIQAADIVVGWELDLLPIREWLGGKRIFLQDVRNYRRVMHRVAGIARRSPCHVAIPRIGDPCVSSGLKGLLKLFEGFAISIIPGISSIQMAAALARIHLDESAIFSFHDFGDQGERARQMPSAFRQGRHLVVLASPDLTPDAMARFLIAQGVSRRTRTIVCSFLTLPQEQILEGSLGLVSRRKFPWLTISVVINPSVATEGQDRQRWLSWRRLRQRILSTG